MLRPRPAFTLIELLIVVVIIGILAAIAIPKFQNTKGKAYYAAMRSDLRNLSTAEEAYFFENRAYTTRLDSLNFVPSTGVTVTVQEATNVGWSAISNHPAAYPHTCAIFMGGAAVLAPASLEGEVGCN